MHRVLRSGIVMLILLLTGVTSLAARSGSSPAAAQGGQDCTAAYQAALTGFMAHCYGGQAGTLCAATDQVEIHMDSGQVVNGAGGAARVSGVASVKMLPGDGTTWSLASLAIPDPYDGQKAATLLVFGPATLEFQPDATLPAGAVFTLSGAGTPAACSGVPQPGVLVQAPDKTLTMLRVNGLDLAINGLTLLHPLDGGGLGINALIHETIIGQTGTVIFAGYAAQVSGGTVSAPAPYDPAAVAQLPVELLPDMQAVALPGNAMVREEMNLFKRPSPDAYTNTMVQAGLPVNIFGRSADNQWVFIRTYDGQRGWFPVGVLEMSVPGEIPVLNDTPPSLIRPYGAVQAIIKTSAENNNLRAGPGEDFKIVATVPLWTSLSLYGRSQDNKWLLVETQDGVRAWVSTSVISNSTPYTLDELPYPPQ